MKEDGLKRIKKILSEPLSDDFFKTFKDLVCLIDTSLLLKLTSEEKIFPIFQEVFGLFKNFGKFSKEEVERIKSDLKEIINV